MKVKDGVNEIEAPEDAEKQEFWRYFGVILTDVEDGRKVEKPQDAVSPAWLSYPCKSVVSHTGETPDIGLNNLIDFALLQVSPKPEIIFKQGYPYLNSLRCMIWTHLPAGHTQLFEYTLHSVPEPRACHYAVVLFRTLQVAVKLKHKIGKENP